MCSSVTVPVSMAFLSSHGLEKKKPRMDRHRDRLHDAIQSSVVVASQGVEVPERDQHEGKFGVLESYDVLKISGGRVKSERHQFFERTYSRVQMQQRS